MSEQQAGQQEAGQQQTAPDANAEQPKPVAPSGEPRTYSEEYVKQLRAEAAENRVKLKQFEDRDKTEAQKTAERIAELERENATHRLDKQREEWARDITKGSHVPAAALRGDSEQAMREHFEELKSLIPENPNPKTVIPGDAERQALPLNGGGIEDALRDALGIH